jgi:RNA polymerase primary sigma factor
LAQLAGFSGKAAMISDALIARGKKQGFVTLEDIVALFPDPDERLDEIDVLCSTLHEMAIEIVQSASLGPMPIVAEPEPESPIPYELDLSLDDLPALYMREIRQIPLLNAEQEIELARLVQRGNHARQRLEEGSLDESGCDRLRLDVRQGWQARQTLVKSSLRLVASVAWCYRNRGLPLLDLIQEGNLGLMKAAERFDPRLGYRFSTYAAWWIRQSITRAIADSSRTIRLPVHVQEFLAKVEQSSRDLTERLGRRPSRKQLADACGMSEVQLARVLDRLPKVRSLDTLVCCPCFPLVRDGTGGALVQQRPCPARQFAELYWHRAVSDDDFEMPPCLQGQRLEDLNNSLEGSNFDSIGLAGQIASSVERATLTLLRESVTELLSGLTERERKVLEMRFGFGGGHECTLEEIGREYGLTRERIRQIEDKALRKLRHPMRSRKLKQFLDSRTE